MFDNPYLCQDAIAHHPLASHPSVIAYCDRMVEEAEISGEELIEGLSKVLESLGDASFDTLEHVCSSFGWA